MRSKVQQLKLFDERSTLPRTKLHNRWTTAYELNTIISPYKNDKTWLKAFISMSSATKQINTSCTVPAFWRYTYQRCRLSNTGRVITFQSRRSSPLKIFCVYLSIENLGVSYQKTIKILRDVWTSSIFIHTLVYVSVPVVPTWRLSKYEIRWSHRIPWSQAWYGWDKSYKIWPVKISFVDM